jgi:hypothetical protein
VEVEAAQCDVRGRWQTWGEKMGQVLSFTEATSVCCKLDGMLFSDDGAFFQWYFM